jgi:glycosyltransferase involved in cell wall biosynthesis
MGDYHRARWKALQEVTTSYAADLGAGDKLYQWNNTEAVEGYYLLSNKPVNQPDWFNRVRNFYHIIRKRNTQVLCIAGYGQPEYIVFILLSKLLGRKVILFAESWYMGNILLDQVKGWFLRLTCHGILASGKRAKQHFSKRLGYPESKIHLGYSVVDNPHFAQKITASAKQKVNQLIHQPVLESAGNGEEEDKRILLCIARFAPEKNLLQLIQSFQASRLNHEWQLVLVGGGPLEEELKQAIHSASVRLLPWQTYKLLPAIYQQAACFILPSTFEPWGLVVNEAMAAGLPIIASDQCGCVPELVQKTNGLTFDAANKDSLVETLNHFSSVSNQELKTMGEASRKIIQDFTPQTWANSIVELTS